MKTNWKKFWTEYPESLGEDEFLKQVGSTVGGKPYTEFQFRGMIESIRDQLQLNESHRLLDICCGNGLVTCELAKLSSSVVGVDFSQPLIGLANKYHDADNIVYKQMDALSVGHHDRSLPGENFDRVIIYGSLQHFEVRDFEQLIVGISNVSKSHAVILLGGVLDIDRRDNFHNTILKKLKYKYYKATGRDRLGTWWDSEYIRAVCEKYKLSCEIDKESSNRPGKEYRFDAIIKFG